MSHVLVEKNVSAYNNGASDYLLLDQNMKELLSADLGEPFDRDKHNVRVQISLNKKGGRFVAFWFEKKK